MSLRRARGLVVWGAMVLVGTACSPVFDWRETRPDDALTLLFPCKPDRFTRQVVVGGVSLSMTLASCQADGQTFALGYLDAPSPDQLGPLMQALQQGLRENVTGATAPQADGVAASAAVAWPVAEPSTLLFKVKGSTPHPLALRVSAAGQRSDGEPVRAEAGFFCRGLRVYQVTMVGRRLDALALETFLTSPALST